MLCLGRIPGSYAALAQSVEHLTRNEKVVSSILTGGSAGERARVGVVGDQAVAAAMIDRIVHHADVLTLKGASHRLRGRGIDSLPSVRTQEPAN